MNPDIEMDPGLRACVEGAKSQSTSKQEDDAMHQRLMERIDTHSYNRHGVRESVLARFGHVLRVVSNLTATAKVAYAGSIATVCVLMVGMFVSGGVSSPAFASVVQKLSTITSMHYHGTMRSNGMDMMQLEVFYLAPSKLRVVTAPIAGDSEDRSMINILDSSQGRGVILMPQAKVATPFEFSPGAYADTPEQDPLHWLDTILNYKGGVEILGPELVLGHHAVGYVIVKPEMTITLWADIETNLPVMFRLDMDESNGQALFEFEATVQFNQQLDESMFSLQPEGGYQIRSQD